MRNRIVPITSIIFILVFGSCAMAEEPQNAFRRVELNWNIRSYNRLSSSKYVGDQLSIAVKVLPRLAAVAEVDEHTDDCGCSKITAQRYGARFSSQLGKRWTHYEQVLAGTAQLDFQNGSSVMAGGGIDFAIRPWLALRPAEIHYTYYHFDPVSNHGVPVFDSKSLHGVRIDGGIVFRLIRK